MAGQVRFIRQPEARYLDRSLDGHVLKKIGGDSVAGVLEAAIAPTMTGDIGRRGLADGNRCRTPDLAGFVVAHIENLARGIADRIVGPRGELVFAAVGRPSVAAAFGRGLEAEARIGDDVDPGRGRRLAGPEYRHIFLAPSRKSPQSVEEFQLGRTQRRKSLRASHRGFFDRTRGLDRVRDAIELIREASLLRHKNNAGGRNKQRARLGGDQVRPKNDRLGLAGDRSRERAAID